MDASNFFYYSLGGGFLVLVLCAAMISYKVWQILGDVKQISEDAAEATADATTLKDGIKAFVVSLAQNLLEKYKKKGGAD